MTAPLFKHQQEGVDFLAKRDGAILADEMGLGKTRQAIVAGQQAVKEAIVVVCPASLKLNWEREIKMVDPFARVVIVGPKTDPSEIEGKRWIVINYDILGKWVGPIAMVCGEYSVIGDEAHYIKGKSGRSKFFMLLAESAKRVWLLTGTPILNRPIELYNLLVAIRHQLAGKGKKVAYEKRYCGAYLQRLYSGRVFWNVRGASNLLELRENISDQFLRRMKDDVMDLPEKIIEYIPVEMSSVDRKRYDSAFDDYLKFVRENPLEGRNIDNILLARHIVELQKLKQVCSEAKLDAIMEAVESAVEAEEKVVIFTQYKHTLEEIRSRVSAMKVSAVSLSGEDNQEARQAAVDAFQRDADVRVFIGNIKAAGVGITLTASSQVIFADLDWTPASHDQAMDRCHRIGQTGTVNVRYFVARDTVEDDIVEMLDSKRAVIKQVMEGGEAGEGQNVADVIGKIARRG